MLHAAAILVPVPVVSRRRPSQPLTRTKTARPRFIRRSHLHIAVSSAIAGALPAWNPFPDMANSSSLKLIRFDTPAEHNRSNPPGIKKCKKNGPVWNADNPGELPLVLKLRLNDVKLLAQNARVVLAFELFADDTLIDAGRVKGLWGTGRQPKEPPPPPYLIWTEPYPDREAATQNDYLKRCRPKGGTAAQQHHVLRRGQDSVTVGYRFPTQLQSVRLSYAMITVRVTPLLFTVPPPGSGASSAPSEEAECARVLAAFYGRHRSAATLPYTELDCFVDVGPIRVLSKGPHMFWCVANRRLEFEDVTDKSSGGKGKGAGGVAAGAGDAGSQSSSSSAAGDEEDEAERGGGEQEEDKSDPAEDEAPPAAAAAPQPPASSITSSSGRKRAVSGAAGPFTARAANNNKRQKKGTASAAAAAAAASSPAAAAQASHLPASLTGLVFSSSAPSICDNSCRLAVAPADRVSLSNNPIYSHYSGLGLSGARSAGAAVAGGDLLASAQPFSGAGGLALASSSGRTMTDTGCLSSSLSAHQHQQYDTAAEREISAMFNQLNETALLISRSQRSGSEKAAFLTSLRASMVRGPQEVLTRYSLLPLQPQTAPPSSSPSSAAAGGAAAGAGEPFQDEDFSELEVAAQQHYRGQSPSGLFVSSAGRYGSGFAPVFSSSSSSSSAFSMTSSFTPTLTAGELPIDDGVDEDHDEHDYEGFRLL